MEKTFKREYTLKLLKIVFYIAILFTGLVIGSFIFFCISSKYADYALKLVRIAMITTFASMVIMLPFVIFKPSFKYRIKVNEDLTEIVFMFGTKDVEVRTIKRNFIITKDFNSVTLDDGITTVELYYNKELLDFLHQIQES